MKSNFRYGLLNESFRLTSESGKIYKIAIACICFLNTLNYLARFSSPVAIKLTCLHSPININNASTNKWFVYNTGLCVLQYMMNSAKTVNREEIEKTNCKVYYIVTVHKIILFLASVLCFQFFILFYVFLG